MTGDAFRKAWRGEPFEPFRLNLASGRTVRVTHPEFVAVSPGARTVAVFERGSEGAEIIGLLLVESIEFENGANGQSPSG